MSNRFLTNKHKNESKFVTKNNLDINSLELFPELKTNIPQTDGVNTNNLSFKTILNTKTAETNHEEPDIILPGWIKLTKNKNMKKKDKEVIEEVEEDLNKVMDKIILEMEDKWNRYEYIYDQIHGEGAYADKFVLPPVYGEEYETDTETEEDNNNNNSDYIISDDENMYNEYDGFD
jgi:uncharacterized protein YcbK (DUF882 family)